MRFVDGAIYGGVGVLTVVLAVDVLNAGDAATGYLNAAIGIGGVTGRSSRRSSCCAAAWQPRCWPAPSSSRSGRWSSAWRTALLAAMAAIVLISAGHLILDVIDTTLLQRVTTDAVRGRAVGAMVMVETIAEAVGSLLLPVLVTTIGGLAVLGIGGLLMLGASALALILIGGAVNRPASPFEGVVGRVAQLPLFASASPAGLELAMSRLTPQPVQRRRRDRAPRRAGRPLLHRGLRQVRGPSGRVRR